MASPSAATTRRSAINTGHEFAQDEPNARRRCIIHHGCVDNSCAECIFLSARNLLPSCLVLSVGCHVRGRDPEAVVWFRPAARRLKVLVEQNLNPGDERVAVVDALAAGMNANSSQGRVFENGLITPSIELHNDTIANLAQIKRCK